MPSVIATSPLVYFDKFHASTLIIPKNDKSLTLLRKHDFYSAWLNAMHALNQLKAIGLEI
jgi:hypothetical protein